MLVYRQNSSFLTKKTISRPMCINWNQSEIQFGYGWQCGKWKKQNRTKNYNKSTKNNCFLIKNTISRPMSINWNYGGNTLESINLIKIGSLRSEIMQNWTKIYNKSSKITAFLIKTTISTSLCIDPINQKLNFKPNL